MTVGVRWSAVAFTEWVDLGKISGDTEESMRRTMWTGACAAVGVVTELVDVHASLSVGVVACDVP